VDSFTGGTAKGWLEVKLRDGGDVNNPEDFLSPSEADAAAAAASAAAIEAGGGLSGGTISDLTSQPFIGPSALYNSALLYGNSLLSDQNQPQPGRGLHP